MRKKKLRTIQKRKISKECWNLDYSFIKWLNEHLKVYKKEASKVINLEWPHRFKFRDREWTQLELINRMIFLTDQLLRDYWDVAEIYAEYMNEILEIWRVVLPAMWW